MVKVKSSINVFIHRRDHRIIDNLGLQLLLSVSDKPVLHVFIFNPEQIEKRKNKYYNKNCIEFMMQSLKSLDDDLRGRLQYFYGTDEEAIRSIQSEHRIETVAWNSDYTPFARARDADLKKFCASLQIKTAVAEDYSLFPMGSILTKGGKGPYKVFTPFYNECLRKGQHHVTMIPEKKRHRHVIAKPFKSFDLKPFQVEANPNLEVHGGRRLALQRLRRVSQGSYKKYDKERDFVGLDGTTKLAAYIKFGCISIREAFATFKESGSKGLVRELLWREFYAHATWHFPHVLQGKPFKGPAIRWSSNKQWYNAVMEGRTGFPIIDASIRHLLATGWMNNRARMIVASFITKDLAMDWQLFERDLFGRHLVDYDPSTNCHSWQGMASVGIDALPYWRVFNPWIQQKKYDKDCEYIKKWVPELANMSPSSIHKWNLNTKQSHEYVRPIIDHATQVVKYKEMRAKYL